MTSSESPHDIAAALRAARLAQGLDLVVLGRELKLPRTTLEAMERGDWARLGAPVFARHLLTRYAERLGIAVDCDSVLVQLRGPELRSQVPQSRYGRLADFSSRQAAYVVGSLLLLPLLYLSLSQWPDAGRSEARALDPLATQAVQPDASDPLIAEPLASSLPSPAAPPPSDAPSLPDAPPTLAQPHTLVSAGLTPVLGSPSPASSPERPAGSGIELRFSAESWIEVFGRDGAVVERVLARAGEVRHWPLSAVGRVTIGNVEATTVLVDGSGVNLESVRAANVARFALSSDGAIEAVPR